MIYSKEFEEKRKEVNKLVKDINKYGDRILAKSLYELANIEDVYINDEIKHLMLKNTNFTKNSDKEIYEMLLKNTFTKLPKERLVHLFQEMYNRASKKDGKEPRYIVSVKGKKSDGGVMGFMEPATNRLNVNGYMINSYKNVPGEETNKYNSRTIGPTFAYVLLHETEHTCQMENAINFAIDKSQNAEKKAMGAMTLMKLAVEEYAMQNEDVKLMDYIEDKYWFDYDEHDANMAPMYQMKKAYEKGEISDPAFIGALKMFEEDSIDARTENATKEQNKQKLESRVLEMESIANYLISVFNAKIKDDPMKRKISETLKAYMRVDEKGNSRFRTRLRSDFDMCLQVMYNQDKFTAKKSNENVMTF